MNNFLLLDFGATRIKTAITDLDTGIFSHIRSHSFLPNCSEIKGRYEISLPALKGQFLSICDLYHNQLGIHFEGIMICSQMHGFALLDGNNNPISNYISWKDERSLNSVNGMNVYLHIKNEFGNKFKKITGMAPRPGLPFINALHMAISSDFESDCKIVSLPEWFSLCCDDSNNLVHETMLAGSGFYDIHKKEVSNELMTMAKKIADKTFKFNTLAPTGSISGYWHNYSERIPIYAGVGDHQCAVLGACNKPDQTISINIGTGSQVAIIDKKIIPDSIELRPYFEYSMLSTITHIPAGRVFMEYLGFLESVCKNCVDTEVDFWASLQKLDENDILNSTLYFDLGLFKSAWNYKNGGMIANISEGNFNLKNYISSLLRCFVKQYLDVIKLMDPDYQINRYILSGGIPRRLPRLANIISELGKCRVLTASEVDETLVGLRTLGLISAKLASNYIEAQEIYGRNAIVI